MWSSPAEPETAGGDLAYFRSDKRMLSRMRVTGKLAISGRQIIVVFLVALALRALFVILVPYTPWSDAVYYDERGWRLAQGLGYTETTGEPTAYTPPMYPLALAAIYGVFGHSVLAARMLNAFFDSVTAGLIYWLVVVLYRDGEKPAGELVGHQLVVVRRAPDDRGRDAVEAHAGALGLDGGGAGEHQDTGERRADDGLARCRHLGGVGGDGDDRAAAPCAIMGSNAARVGRMVDRSSPRSTASISRSSSAEYSLE